jgi:hypothetical protein
MTLLEFQEFINDLDPQARARFEKLFKNVYTIAKTIGGRIGQVRPLILNDPPDELSFEEAIKAAWPDGHLKTNGLSNSAIIEFATGKVKVHY